MALNYSIFLGDEKIVKSLIANGVDFNIADASGEKPCDIAIKNGIITLYYKRVKIA